MYAKHTVNIGISTKREDFEKNIHNVYSNTTQRVYKKSYKRWNTNDNSVFLSKYKERVYAYISSVYKFYLIHQKYRIKLANTI